MQLTNSLRLLTYVDTAGNFQSRMLMMDFERARAQFSNLHAGTQLLPEELRANAVGICGIYHHVNGKWEKDNG